MPKAEVVLGWLTLVLMAVAVALTVTLPAMRYTSYVGPTGAGPAITFVDALSFRFDNVPVMVSVPSALVVCLGAVIDVRVSGRTRALPMAMVLGGALMYGFAFYVAAASGALLVVGGSLSNLSRATLIPLTWVYAPSVIAAALCVLVALPPRHLEPRTAVQG